MMKITTEPVPRKTTDTEMATTTAMDTETTKVTGILVPEEVPRDGRGS